MEENLPKTFECTTAHTETSEYNRAFTTPNLNTSKIRADVQNITKVFVLIQGATKSITSQNWVYLGTSWPASKAKETSLFFTRPDLYIKSNMDQFRKWINIINKIIKKEQQKFFEQKVKPFGP